jgi:hypothetical protein
MYNMEAAMAAHFETIAKMCLEVDGLLDNEKQDPRGAPQDRFGRVFLQIKSMYNRAHALVQRHDKLVYTELEKTLRHTS